MKTLRRGVCVGIWAALVPDATNSGLRAASVWLGEVSGQKTDLVEDFLAEHRRVRIHYTPTYSSWLNQVEN